MKDNYIKFYGEADLSTSYDIENVENYIDNFSENSIIDSLNSVLELYNVLQFLNIDYFKEKNPKITDFKSRAYIIFNEFFKNKTIMSFIKEYDDLNFQYNSDFWKLFVSQKVINNTSFEKFEEFVTEKDIPVYLLLQEINICQKYQIFIKKLLLSDPKKFELLVDKYDSVENPKFYLPNNISKEEINEWAEKYCDLKDAELKHLEKISKWSLHHEVKLDSTVKLKAKKAHEDMIEEIFKDNKGIGWGVGVILKNGLSDNFEFNENDRTKMVVTFNKDWLDDNQDYPTILNNFIYFFELFNSKLQFSMIESPYEQGGLTDLFRTKSKYYYKQSYTADLGISFYKLTFLSYYDYLVSEKIDLENVFSYYYNNLLDEEYGFSEFFFNPSTKGNTYYERCKILIPEMDSLLKQFDFLQRYGKIDFELFELESQNTPYRDIKSLKNKKFIYINSSEAIKMCNLFFNSQSLLSFPEHKKNKNNFYEYLISGIKVEDFYPYQKHMIEVLVEQDVLEIDEKNNLIIKNRKLIELYWLLWDKGYLSILSVPEDIKEMIQSEILKGNLKVENTLFSKQESDYISFVMDNKKFSNGLFIRNKITHGSFANKEESEYKNYYLELLLVLLLYTVRINEELDCSNENLL